MFRRRLIGRLHNSAANRMKRNDWIGLGASIALHAGVLFGFAFLTVSQADSRQIGFIEVEFGPYAESRASEAPVAPEEPQQPRREPAPAPEETRQVDLPDQLQSVPEEDQVTTPEVEEISPERQNSEEPAEEPDPEPEPPPVRPLGSATPGEAGETRPVETGEGLDELTTAPFEIEGLNRDPMYAPVPEDLPQVEATIRVRITVDPQGRVAQRFLLLKGDADLEKATMDILQRWRFNPLPPNAPQEPQTGIVTFRFRLE